MAGHKAGLGLFLLASSLIGPPVMAGPELGSGLDCTSVELDFKDDPALTRQERLAQMDRALMESLERFELCEGLKRTSQTNGQGAGAGAQNGLQNGLEGAESSIDSIGASDVSGENDSPEYSQTPAQENDPARAEGDISDYSVWSDPDENASSQNQQDISQKESGRVPEDIPDAANDDVLAQQIRRAAENEPDPEKRAKLWDEYRKYKGLPGAPPKEAAQ